MSCAALEAYDCEGLTALMWAARYRLPATVKALCGRAIKVSAAAAARGETRLLDVKARERGQLWREPCRRRHGETPSWGRTALEMFEANIVSGVRATESTAKLCETELRKALRFQEHNYGPAAAALIFDVCLTNAAPMFPRELATVICAYADLPAPKAKIMRKGGSTKASRTAARLTSELAELPNESCTRAHAVPDRRKRGRQPPLPGTAGSAATPCAPAAVRTQPPREAKRKRQLS
jgi:hypothetical protein